MIEYVVSINDVRFCTFVCLRLLDISKKLKLTIEEAALGIIGIVNSNMNTVEHVDMRNV